MCAVSVAAGCARNVRLIVLEILPLAESQERGHPIVDLAVDLDVELIGCSRESAAVCSIIVGALRRRHRRHRWADCSAPYAAKGFRAAIGICVPAGYRRMR